MDYDQIRKPFKKAEPRFGKPGKFRNMQTTKNMSKIARMKDQYLDLLSCSASIWVIQIHVIGAEYLTRHSSIGKLVTTRTVILSCLRIHPPCHYDWLSSWSTAVKLRPLLSFLFHLKQIFPPTRSSWTPQHGGKKRTSESRCINKKKYESIQGIDDRDAMLDFGRIRRHRLLNHFRIRLLPSLLQLAYEPIIPSRLVALMIPLLVMLDNLPLAVQRQCDFGVYSLLRPLRFERYNRLEHVVLSEVERQFIGRRFGKEIALLGDGLSENLGHAVELWFDAVEPVGYTDRVMEGGGGAVVGVGALGGLELVKE